MMFDIQIIEDTPPVGRGKITIGEFSEGFEIVLEHWNSNEYRLQWLNSLRRLANNTSETEALITSLTDPSTANFLFWWPVYLDGDEFVLQSHVLIFEDLDENFRLENYTEFIPPRETVDEDGDDISEWRISIDDVRSFLKANPNPN